MCGSPSSGPLKNRETQSICYSLSHKPYFRRVAKTTSPEKRTFIQGVAQPGVFAVMTGAEDDVAGRLVVATRTKLQLMSRH